MSTVAHPFLSPVRRACARALLLAALAVGAAPARAAEAAPEAWAMHGQVTYVEQESDGFRAPYAGPNSLTPSSGRETADATVYLGVRLAPATEAWLDAELDQGFGLDDTLGVAGFTSGEAYKVGAKRPYLRLARAFVRHSWALGDAREPVAGGANQLAGTLASDRLVLTVGKWSVGDLFDTNRYAHDPRGDFLNWGAIDAAAFDYAADAWGYTVGAALEWYAGPYTTRAALVDLSDVPNSPHLDPGGHEYQQLLELEHRHVLGGAPGALRLTAFSSHARLALLREASEIAAASGGVVDLATLRRPRTRTGLVLGVEQALTDALGLFARAGGASGNVEAYDFTDVDRSLAAGASLRGAAWRRPEDTVGMAWLENRASAARQRFLAAGGLGILIGDGRLPHPGAERGAELYYAVRIAPGLTLTVDAQRVWNPAYNRDRGPATVLALRVHAER